jgi:putative ABC transport system substrate-binding protein
MDRRAFLCGLTLGSLAAPQAAPARIRQVGWLALMPQPSLQTEFRRGMRELGHVEGSSYVLLERYAEADQLFALAADLVRLKVDVIVAEAGLPIRGARSATTTIPIVFITGEPLVSGFVQNMRRPGGNLTGIANLELELYPKRIEALKDALPRLRRLAVVSAALPRRALISRTIQDAASAHRIEALPVAFVSHVEELDVAFAQAARARADAMLVSAHSFFNVHRDRLLALAARHRLPTLYAFRDFVEAGGLMCYGADMKDVYRRLASYVDRILQGADPADLPVEQPTKFELVINLKTAKALGLTIPPSLLARADEVIK